MTVAILFVSGLGVFLFFMMWHYAGRADYWERCLRAEERRCKEAEVRYSQLSTAAASRAALLEKAADQAYERALKNATEDLRLIQAQDFDAGRRAAICKLRESLPLLNADYIDALVRYEELEIKQQWGKV